MDKGRKTKKKQENLYRLGDGEELNENSIKISWE